MVNTASLKQFNFPDWALNPKRRSNILVFNSKWQKKELTLFSPVWCLSMIRSNILTPSSLFSVRKFLKKSVLVSTQFTIFSPLSTKKLEVFKVCNIINKYLRQPLKGDYSPNTFSWPLQAVFLLFLIKIKLAKINHLWEFLTLEISKSIKTLQYKRLFFVLSLG